MVSRVTTFPSAVMVYSSGLPSRVDTHDTRFPGFLDSIIASTRDLELDGVETED